MKREKFAASFWSRVNIQRPDECWEWKSSRHPRTGYGSVYSGVRSPESTGRARYQYKLAHRVAYELAVGPIPEGRWFFICHKCDNPPCCNPAHLFLGDPQINQTDCVNKGRHPSGYDWVPRERRYKGERHHSAKLTTEQVVSIRERAAAGEVLAALGREFDMTTAAVSRLVRGDVWKDVGGPVVTEGRLPFRNGSTRLTEAQAREIRDSDRSISGRELATKYGVSGGQVNGIRAGRYWKNLK